MIESVSSMNHHDHGSAAVVDDSQDSPFIQIKNLTKQFGAFTAVDSINLDIYKGEFFALLGGSGCGKTTLLRMLAGFETPTDGTILIDGVDMTNIPPYERPVNMMFQSYALFPHMNVEKNVAYGLKRDGVPAKEINARVDEILAMVEMLEFGKRKPNQLSGGQRQRVALARALVKRPKVLLLDEPLAALDKRLREQTQFELMNIQDQLGITFIVVTHDQEEAMTLATRIAVMNQGKFMQIGSPADIYENPDSRFIANFIGSTNLIDVQIVSVEGDEYTLEASHGEQLLQVESNSSISPSTELTLSIRPEKISIQKGHLDAGKNTLHGTVEELAYLGRLSTYRVKLATGPVLEVTVANQMRSKGSRHPVSWGDAVTLSFNTSSAVLLQQ